MSSWQPIKTAPKDGLIWVVGVYKDDGELYPLYAVAYWDMGTWFEHRVADPLDFKPTHWMPIKKPPKPTQKPPKR